MAAASSEALRDTLLGQLDIAWQLALYHLETLTTEECLWQPAPRGLHIRPAGEGVWVADWPESEGYDIGPASIGWLTWHLMFWWSMAFDHAFGEGTLRKEDVHWPGSAEAVRAAIGGLHERWKSAVAGLSESDLLSPERSQWPVAGRPLPTSSPGRISSSPRMLPRSAMRASSTERAPADVAGPQAN